MGRGLRIGYPAAATYSLAAAQGAFALTGQAASLNNGVGNDANYDAAYSSAFSALSPGQTKYVAPSGGSNGNNGNSEGAPYATIAYALSQISAGGMVIVLDGTISVGASGWINDEYAGVTPPSGASWAAPTVIRAKNRFGVTLSQASADYDGHIIRLQNVSNVWIDGFLIDSQSQPAEVVTIGSNNCLTRCGVRMREVETYGKAITFWSNSVVEDCFVYGAGRYTIQSGTGGSDSAMGSSVVRRCVVYNPFGPAAQPTAAYCMYGSNSNSYAQVKDVLWANCIDIDSPSLDHGDPDGTRWASFYFPKSVRNMQLNGCMSINVAARYGGVRSDNYGGAGAVLYQARDCAVVNLQSGGGTPTAFGADVDNGTNSAINCTTSNIPGSAFSANVSQTSCRTSGSIYPPQRVSGTGAEIKYPIGTLRSRWGDSGYATENTGLRLWPWPYEETIKSFFSTTLTRPTGYYGSSSSSNPFATKSVTERAWEALGNVPDYNAIY